MGPQGAACRWSSQLLGSSCQPRGREGSQAGGGTGHVWPSMAGLAGRSELRGPTEQGHGAGHRRTLLDVLPVGQLGVSLLSRAAMELEKQPHREGGKAQGGGAPERERETKRKGERNQEKESETERENERDPG